MSGLKRSITHWTAGAGMASEIDKKHYHGITQWDGSYVKGHEELKDNIVTSDGDYAAHVLNLNTGSAGFAVAGMRGAIESPFDAGDSPINRIQFEAHCKRLAQFHMNYGIPVTRETCLTHAEVQPTLGVRQRGKWDFTRLPFELEIRGAIPCGDYMRARVKSYMPFIEPEFTNRPILRVGARGAFVVDLQDQLADLRFFAGKKDGKFGPRTKASVIAFQHDNGLHEDGVVGSGTWDALSKAEPQSLRDYEDGDLARSRTMKEVSNVKKTIGVSSVGATLLTVADNASTVQTVATQSQSLLETANHIALNYWPLLAVILVGGGIWFAVTRIADARIEDHQTGANIKR